jgi:hypothetical protein
MHIHAAIPSSEYHCKSVSPHISNFSPKAQTKRGMAFLSISHMPFLSLAPSHLPRDFGRDVPTKSSQVSTMQGRQLYIRYLHLRQASQITQRMPAPCFLYTSTRRRTQSPLRTTVTQDRAETVQRIMRSRRRFQGPSESSARDALSNATSSQSRMMLLPNWRSPMARSRYNDAAQDPY